MSDAVKITRSRTVKRKVASSGTEFQKAFANLREIETQQSSNPSTDDRPSSSASVEPLPKKKKVGHPKIFINSLYVMRLCCRMLPTLGAIVLPHVHFQQLPSRYLDKGHSVRVIGMLQEGHF